MGRRVEKSRLPERRSRGKVARRPWIHGARPVSPGPGHRVADRYILLAVSAFLLLAVALVFGQTAGHQFVEFDDPDYVFENPPVARGVTAEGITWAFTQFYAANWHPLTWLSHMVDCQLFGPDHAGRHHLTSVLLHALSAVILFLVVRQMTGDLWPSAFAALLFAIHPLHVESVAWVAERKDVLSGLFFMLTLGAYVGYARRPFSLFRYLLVTALFALGLMAKPMLVTLPFVLLLLDYWPLGRGTEQGAWSTEPIGKGIVPSPFSLLQAPGSVLLEKLPWFGLAAASCVVTQLAQQKVAVASLKDCPFAWRVANALDSWVIYLRQFLYPADLAAYYPHPQNSLPMAEILGAVVLLIGISLAVLAFRRTCPFLLVGWAWYLGMLVPVIGLVQIGFQARADRYTYLPQIGLYIAAAWGAAHFAGQSPPRRRAIGMIGALAAAGLIICAWQQAAYWKDNETIWRHTVACTSKNSLGEVNFAVALAQRGEFDEAIEHCQAALKIDSGDAKTHAVLGAVLASSGRIDEGIVHLRKALEIKPGDAYARQILAVALSERERMLKAPKAPSAHE
jgi:protein O-mannosyl-transferase